MLRGGGSVHPEECQRAACVTHTEITETTIHCCSASSFRSHTVTLRALRGVTVPLTLRRPHRSICRWFNNMLMCGARSHPLIFWDVINSALHMFTIPDCLQSWLWCLRTGPSPKDLAPIPAATPGSTLPCSRCQPSSLNRPVLCTLSPSKAKRGAWMTQLSKRAEGLETSQHSSLLAASAINSCGGVCVLPYACLFLSGGGGGGLGSLELAPDHPQNKGRAVLLKSRTEAKLLPPEKGGNKGGPVAWRGAAGLEWLPGVLWVWCSVCPILCWSTA